ncbi:hypothetical protein AACH06_25470 [Ideonella sp. DXS29W]|uniref:Uncharacterized protein n=1 Tax=Ideonella lacteola TaxID=2984193 RepID=A0ABU9C030_9BURK
MTEPSHFDLDDVAVAGYSYAGGHMAIPRLENQLDIDAFNMGIRQYNDRHGTNVSRVVESVREVRHDNSSGRADKELAISSNH